jgi:hypothetical protein
MSEFVGPFLIRLWDTTHTEETLIFWCPGCKMTHPYRVRTPNGRRPSWNFNGDGNRPTFTPSLLVYNCTPTGNCHLLVTEGQIAYCNDSAHDLAGKTVAMVPINEEWEPVS